MRNVIHLLELFAPLDMNLVGILRSASFCALLLFLFRFSSHGNASPLSKEEAVIWFEPTTLSSSMLFIVYSVLDRVPARLAKTTFPRDHVASLPVVLCRDSKTCVFSLVLRKSSRSSQILLPFTSGRVCPARMFHNAL